MRFTIVRHRGAHPNHEGGHKDKASSDKDYDRYGFAAGNPLRDGIIEVNKIVEKPGKEAAPSDMATCSGFLLTPDIFKYLHQSFDILIMAIILFIKINNIFKKIDAIVDKAENFVTSAEKFGSKLEKVASMATYTTMFKNLVGSIFNK